jgi:hypothetical protein
MFWAVVSWGIRPVCLPAYGAFLAPAPHLPGALWRDRSLFAGPMGGPGEQVRGLCAGQFTAEWVKTWMAVAVVRVAQLARTSRLRAASVVVLVIPQMSCSPAPVWSSTP